jgi:hypothetical protein
MSAGEWLAATGAVLLAVLLGGLLFALASVAATLRDLRRTVRALQDESLALVGEMRDALRDAENEIDRVGALLTAAESVGDHIDTASRIVSATVTNPVVKVLALGSGTKRAVRRMRTGDDAAPAKRKAERARSAEPGAAPSGGAGVRGRR